MDFDVVIVGAGLVGASLAVALGRRNLAIALVEASPPGAVTAEWDSRVYAISPASQAFLSSLGVWQALDPLRVQPVERMAVFGDRRGARLEFSAYEAGVATLAHIAEAGRIARALWDAAASLERVRTFAPARCERLAIDERGAALELAGSETLRAQLVVGADGAQSWVRRMAGLTARATSYGQLGVVANFALGRPHLATAFQWFRADGVLAARLRGMEGGGHARELGFQEVPARSRARHALMFLVVGLIAGALGLAGIAAVAAKIAGSRCSSASFS